MKDSIYFEWISIFNLKTKIMSDNRDYIAMNKKVISINSSLPNLVIEEHHKKYIAYLDGVKGIVAQGDTKEEVVDEIMLLIKIKLLYDLDNKP